VIIAKRKEEPVMLRKTLVISSTKSQRQNRLKRKPHIQTNSNHPSKNKMILRLKSNTNRTTSTNPQKTKESKEERSKLELERLRISKKSTKKNKVN
jgi:stress response protein YsnF